MPLAAACEGPFEGTKSLLGEGQSNNFLELICGKWRPMGARVGDSTQPAPSTIGESITRQTGVTRKQRSLLGCEKHLLKLLLPLRTVSCFIFPKHREPQVSGKGQESVFLWHSTMPATHSEWSWGLTGTSTVCAAVPRKARESHRQQLQASLVCTGWSSTLHLLRLSKERRASPRVRRSQIPNTELYAPAHLCFPKLI